MIRFYCLLVCVVLGMSELLSQTYPQATIREIQEIPDSVLNSPSPNTNSAFLADTVWVRGVVATAPRLASGAAQWFTGDRWRFILKDPSQSIFNNITVVASDTAWFRDSVGIDLLVVGDSVEILGYITEFRQLTQLEVVKKKNVMNLLGISSHVPTPVVLPLSQLFTGTTFKYNPGEKHESGFLRVENLTVISVNNFEFTVADQSGNQIIVDDQSTLINPGYVGYTRPPSGAKIDWVQGYVFTNSSLAWTINPRDTTDYQVGVFAPSISQIARVDTFPGPATNVQIRARILDQDGSVASAKLYYSVNGVAMGSISMASAADSQWSATVPAVGVDSAFVTYYIVALDNAANLSISPSDTVSSRLFYFSLNRSPKIAEIQYNPYGGSSSYVGAMVTVRGIATTDRRDYGAIFMQEGSAAWKGIRVNSTQDSVVRRGDDLSATGVVFENFSHTVINNATLTVHSTANTMPAPVGVLSTNVRTGGSQAEWYESVLVELNNVYVVNLNEDAVSNSNFGEFGLNESNLLTTGLRVDDFSKNLPYTNDSLRSGQSGKIQVKVGDSFQSVRGVLEYSFSNFKLLPRDSADFTGYVVFTGVEQLNNDIPAEFDLSQNYPNPFNPSTTIEYSLIQESNVSLQVFNVLGQLVGTPVQGHMNAGTYRLHLGSDFFRNLSSGMYIYQFRAGSFSATRKMIFIR